MPSTDKIEAIRLKQMDLDIFFCKMKVKDILDVIDKSKAEKEKIEENQNGKYKEKVKEIKNRLVVKNKTIQFPTSPILTLHPKTTKLFYQKNDDTPILLIPRKTGAASAIDGQERIYEFQELVNISKNIKDGEEGIEKFVSDLLELELPIIFLYSEKNFDDENKPIFSLSSKPTKMEGYEIRAENSEKYSEFESQAEKVRIMLVNQMIKIKDDDNES